VSQKAGIAERMIITLDELKKATRNFDEDLVVGGGGHGTVYMGILSNQHIVAIKKPKKLVQKEIDEFINEVAILSQINHRNVVKLYGCCLETEVPMLIYEFISNGTLSEHLHVEGPKSLSWSDRLRIAIETSKSIAYLHSTTSIPIIHRDIKSANILLDDSLIAKVADFGASRCIPIEKSGITTKVQGTRGYWDPACFYTGRLTEKSDVFSFGVVLVELLTRKKPFEYLSSDDEALIVRFARLFAEGNLVEILDPQIVEEGGHEVEEVANIAVACIKLTPESRPTMRQVELTLEGIRVIQEGTLDNVVSNNVYTTDIGIYDLSAIDRRGSEGSTRCYSMEEEFALSARYSR
jgi:serine/threonine protein kinase